MSTIQIAPLNDIVEQIRGVQGRPVNDQMTELFDVFLQAARTIDPTITGQWIAYDVDDRGCKSCPAVIGFERGHSVVSDLLKHRMAAE